MDFREGMLGVVIVALALTGAMFVSYFAGIEAEEQDVIKYQYLADVSGQFDYDKTPTYVEFDPSSNYTGYYSEDTGEYFPVDKVGYVENERVNNYRINLEPELLSSGTTDPTELTNLVAGYPGETKQIFIYNTSDDYAIQASGNYSMNTITLDSYTNALINDIDSDSSVDYIEFRSNGIIGNSELTSPADFVLFSVKNQWTEYDPPIFPVVHALLIVTDEYMVANNLHVNDLMEVGTGFGTWELRVQKAFLSALVDVKSKVVNLYYTNDCTGSSVLYSMENVFISYGGGTETSPYNLVLDSTFEYTAVHKDTVYLNPNYGVVMKDE